MEQDEDPVGHRFGKLVCIKQVGTRGGGRLFLFRCDCGREFEATAHSLEGKRHCGCGYDPVICVVCGQEFVPKRFGAITCSSKCNKIYWTRQNRKSNKKKSTSLLDTIKAARIAKMSYGEYQAEKWKEAKA